jgi:hypothetical protein
MVLFDQLVDGFRSRRHTDHNVLGQHHPHDLGVGTISDIFGRTLADQIGLTHR